MLQLGVLLLLTACVVQPIQPAANARVETSPAPSKAASASPAASRASQRANPAPTPTQSAPSYTPVLIKTDCPFRIPAGLEAGKTVLCGRLRVPQDRSRPQGVQVEIPYALVKSSLATPQPEPLIYLVGGPGGTALADFETTYNWFQPFRQDRDLVFFDQRGTRLGSPVLDCTPFGANFDYETTRPTVEAEVPANLRPINDDTVLLPTCIQQLQAEGVDFTQYNSATNAADTLDLIRALGYSTYDLYGSSYGTRLALTIMRQQPEGLRAVILDSVYPQPIQAYEQVIVKQYEIVQRVWQQCATDPACNAAFPNLAERFAALVTRLNQTPLRVADQDQATISGNDLLDLVLHTTNSLTTAYLPLMIAQLERGVPQIYFAITRDQLPPPGGSPAGSPSVDDPNGIADFTARLDAALRGIKDRSEADEANAALDQISQQGSNRQRLVAFIQTYFSATTATDLIRRLNRISDQGVTSVLDSLATPPNSLPVDGVTLAVECHEEVPFNSLQTALTAHQALNIPDEVVALDLDFVRQTFAQCALLATGKADEIENQPVTSDIPTLIYQGLSDTNTPPSWSALARKTLRNNQYAEFPNTEHVVIENQPACAATIGRQFLNNIRTKVDTSCIDRLRVPFVTRPPS